MLVFEERGKSEYPEKNLSEQRIDCSQSPIFSWDRGDIARLTGCHLACVSKLLRGPGAVWEEPNPSPYSYNPRRPPPRYILKSRWPPLTVRRAISRPSHGKIGDCGQSKQRREPTTNSTHIWRRRRDLNPGHIGGRRALSPLRHPLLHSWNPFHSSTFHGIICHDLQSTMGITCGTVQSWYWAEVVAYERWSDMEVWLLRKTVWLRIL